jgi:hypothetical protein
MADFVQTTRDLSLESSAEEKFRLAVEACPNALPGIYNTPIMVISDDNSEDKGGGLDISHLNVLECIHKPVNVDQVAQILDRVIARDADGRAQILHVGDDREAV